MSYDNITVSVPTLKKKISPSAAAVSVSHRYRMRFMDNRYAR